MTAIFGEKNRTALYAAAVAIVVVQVQGFGSGGSGGSNGGSHSDDGTEISGRRPLVRPTSLKSVPVPEPPNLGDFVRDRQAAIVLGKTLFWDTQVGSDNRTACASCHFHAGADMRVKNQLNPDLPNMAGEPVSTTFDRVASGEAGGPNYTLKTTDFPFHQLLDPDDRESIVLFDSDDVVGSAGVFNSEFGRLLRGRERNRYAPDGVFQVGSVETRRVTGRNTPSNLNAVLNFRLFWDGRANFVFNGVTPFGPRDESARIWVDDTYTDADGNPVEQAVPAMVRIPFAGAASQAVGPALNAFEMSAAGRVWADLGRKLMRTWPLRQQKVSPTDSVLGPYRDANGEGLSTTYEALIRQAFWPDFWQVPDPIFMASSGTNFRQIEMNFSLFWGLAIQLYESTLISDDSRFDRFSDGDQAALTAQERVGLAIFSSDRGRCVNCHKGAEFTGASTRMVLGSRGDGADGDGPIENMLMGDRQVAVYDNGFYNIGVTPAGQDVGVGGTDPFGNPLSFTREFLGMAQGVTATPPDALSHSLDPCTFQAGSGCTVVTDPFMRDAVDGSFKTPSLRNVELTGPYFHNGGYSTLEQVVDFYNRGGNVRATPTGDTSGHGPHGSNVDLDVRPLGLSKAEKAALVAFMKSLTDERVRWEKAPFDHPSIRIPHGAMGDDTAVSSVRGRAADEFLVLPAVGAEGRRRPIKPFTPALPTPAAPPPVDPPVTTLPVDPPATPPPVDPPATTPPVDPPATTPPVDPPATTPPVDPPATTPPVDPPVTTPPVDPPATTPPVDPPVTTPPVDPPATAPPVDPPVTTPPVDPPVTTPPATTSPVTTPPVTRPPVITPPVTRPPVAPPPVTPPPVAPSPAAQPPAAPPPVHPQPAEPPAVEPSSTETCGNGPKCAPNHGATEGGHGGRHPESTSRKPEKRSHRSQHGVEGAH